MTFRDKVRDTFQKNVVAWFLFALLLIAAYGNYQRGKELDRVCELSGPHVGVFSSPKNDKEELDSICVARQSGE